MLCGVSANAQAITTWSVGTVTIDCEQSQICYPIMVQSTIANSQLSFVTLRFIYDPTLINMLTIQSIENGYVVSLEQETSPTVGEEFGFATDAARFPRISISPNIANYLNISNGVPTHVYDMCFNIVSDPIPDELCAALIFDYNHTVAPGIANDAGYFVGDAGLATQYVVNGGGSAIAADDDAMQFLWMGNPGFISPLDMIGEIVGDVAATGCIETNCSPLAVGLLKFRAYRLDESALLEWTTTFEVENDYFDIERSAEAQDFVAIGRNDANGSGSGIVHYSFVDDKPVRGVNYYRLKLVDNSGHSTYSPVQSVVFDEDSGLQIRVAPNPISESIVLNVDLGSGDNEVEYVVRILNTSGQLLIKENIVVKGQIQEVFDVSTFPSGFYLMEISGKSGETVHTEKLVKFE